MKEQKPRKNMKKGKKFISEPELVAKLYDELIEDYGYNPAQIKTDYRISGLKMERVVADIAIFKEEDTSELETIIEVHSSIRPMEDNSIDYFFEVLAESKAEYGMFYNGFKKTCFKKILNDQIIETNNIPSKKKIKKVEKIDIKLKFWKIFEHLRATVPSTEYSKILMSLLYLKFNDEKYYDNKFFETLTNYPEINKEELYTKFQNHDDDSEINLNILKEIKPKLLSSLLFEMQNIMITKLDPEVIAEEFFKIRVKFSNLSYRNSNPIYHLPKNIVKFMYLVLMHSGNHKKINELNILSAYSSDKRYFELIDLSSDHLHLTGKNLKKYCEEKITIIEKEPSMLSSLNILLKIKGYSPKLIQKDPAQNDYNEKFDLILATPSITDFGHKLEQPDSDDSFQNNPIMQFLNQLNPGGRLAILVQPNFLFNKKYSKLREVLIKKYKIDGIVKLPSQTFYHSGIRPVILFIENSPPLKQYSILMSNLDITNAFGYSPSNQFKTKNLRVFDEVLDEIIGKTEDIQVNKKISKENFNIFWRPSTELIHNDWSVTSNYEKNQKIINPKNIQFVKNNETFNGSKLIFGKNLRKSKSELDKIKIINQIKISDIDETGKIIKFQQQNNLPYEDFPKIIFVKENDLVLSLRGTIGKVAMVSKNHDGAVIDSRFVIIRSKNKKDSENLFNILKSESFQEKLKELSSGTVIPNIRHKDLEKIYLTPFEENKMEKITNLRKEIEIRKEKLFKNEVELEKLLKEKNDS
jgi:type I restriction-modification system DNA methylase subunit